jgi:hypothetical protein
MRHIIRHATAALATLTLAAAAAPAAEAYSATSGCTTIGSGGVVCINVWGSGLYVDRARATISSHGGTYCNTRLYITFYDNNNTAYRQTTQSTQSGCVYPGQSRELNTYPRATMRPGRVCAAVSISGSMKPGACVAIYR